MSVWIVTTGENADYTIQRVFLGEGVANEYAEHLKEEGWSHITVQEWEPQVTFEGRAE